MMTPSIVFQRPTDRAAQLFLLHHGAAGTAADLQPLAQALGEAFPQAFIVGVDAPFPAETGTGRQWFSVDGITEENRPERVAHAMPLFVEATRRWQQETGVAAPATALLGFSQGAILALESTQCGPLLAGRVVALAGRFASLPLVAPQETTLHLVHGKVDPVIHYRHCVAAAERWVSLGGDVTADVIPFLGHAVTPEVVARLLERLQGHVPKRVWAAAMAAAQAEQPDGQGRTDAPA